MMATQAGFTLASDLDLHRRASSSREHLSHFCFGSVGKIASSELTHQTAT
jgi:hypothetical protein